jgi:hypothetical protein
MKEIARFTAFLLVQAIVLHCKLASEAIRYQKSAVRDTLLNKV